MKGKYPVFSFFKFSILLTFSLVKTACLLSQNSDIKITLHEKEMSPLIVFQKIESQCDFHFIYDEQNIDGLNQIVSIDCMKESLNYVLNAIEKQTRLSFRVYDKSIAVSIKKKRITISGFVTDSLTGDYLIGAVVFMLGSNVGATTNESGYYSISVPEETVNIKSRFLGFESKTILINSDEDIYLDIKLSPQKTMLREVLVSTTNLQDTINENVDGVSSIGVKEIGSLPMTYSEPDIVKSTYYLPGVSRLNYGSTGYSVRGSSVGDNMVLFDNCRMYNISHRLADLSIFNPDIIQNMSMYKGGIPVQYEGGASVLDVTSRNGDMKHFHLRGGFSPISSRLSVEFPVFKNKLSFLFSLRRSTLEWLKWFDTNIYKNRFYDINSKLYYKINQNNQLSFAFYLGQDKEEYESDEDNHGQYWTTSAGSLTWVHRFKSHLVMHSSMFYTEYDYEWDNVNYSIWNSYYDGADVWIDGAIIDFGFKQNYTWDLNIKNKLIFGWNFSVHDFFTDDYLTTDSIGNSDWTNCYDFCLYADHEKRINENLNMTYGLRWSGFFADIFEGERDNDNLGSWTQYRYDLYDYLFFDPRVALSFRLSAKNIVKWSYNRTSQAIHQVSYLGNSSNSYFVYIPSTTINPKVGNQLSLGFYHNTQASNFSYSAEAFYKNSRNNISYFTDSLSTNTTLSINTSLVSSKGTSFGLEWFFRMAKDRWNGTVSYTLSRSLRQSDEVNNGDWYRSNYDRPQNLALNMNYFFTPDFRFTCSWLYSTGMPSSVTYSDLKNGNLTYDINHINKYRLPDYHRLDMGLVYENKSKAQRKFHSIWSINLYNVYNRDNRYINEGISQNSSSGYNNTTLFDDYGIMPAISYSFKF